MSSPETKLTFSDIKPKVKNLGNFKTLAEIKKAGLRVVKTKAGDFWLIEAEFLKPVVKSPKECKSIIVKPEDLKFKVLMCPKPKSELKGKKILDYIAWGEKQGFHQRPTCKNREWWWELGLQEPAFCSYPMINNERLIFSKNQNILNDANLVGIHPLQNYGDCLLFVLNATFNMLNLELFGISNLGEGAIKQNPAYIKNFSFILNPKFFNKNQLNPITFSRPIYSIFTELGFDKTKPVREQEPNPLPDRKALDDIVFDALGLTQAERKEVYWAVAELVQNRLSKAKNV